MYWDPFVKKAMHIWRFISNYNLPTKARKDVQHHYDIGEDLYDIFLDKKHRQYSCAYFKTPQDTLEQAQQNKLDHIIKKLSIKPGAIRFLILVVAMGRNGL